MSGRIEIMGRFTAVESPRLSLIVGVADRFRQDHSLDIVSPAEVNKRHVWATKRFLAEAALEVAPPVYLSWWEHILLAPRLRRQIADAVVVNGAKDTHPMAVEAALNVHDIGRFVNPGAYLRNDFLGEVIIKHLGLEPLISQLASLRGLLMNARDIQITDEQLGLFQQGVPIAEILGADQLMAAAAYFDSLSPAQRISNLADNLGKRDGQGKLFSMETFLRYLRSQETRYTKTSPWPSVNWSGFHRQASAVLQAYVIEKTVDWLKLEYGVDTDSVLQQFQDYGLRFVVLVRHGKVADTGIVYNRDVDMDEADRVSLGQEGREQITALAQLLKKRGVEGRIALILASPQERVQESARILQEELGVNSVTTEEQLDDLYAPGPYKERLPLDEWRRTGNPYDQRWNKYGHETPEAVSQRMSEAFWRGADQLKTGQVAIEMSHGDLLAWLINGLLGKKPLPQDLIHSFYPQQGQAWLAVVGSDKELVAVYPMI